MLAQKGFYQGESLSMQAWDSLCLFVFSDAHYVGVILDRNSL